MAIGRTFKESLQKCLRSLEIGRNGLGGDGKPWRTGTEVYGDPHCKNNVSRPPSPRPSPQGEGAAIVRPPIARRAFANRRLTTFQETGERFSFSPGEKAGMRAGVEQIKFRAAALVRKLPTLTRLASNDTLCAGLGRCCRWRRAGRVRRGA